MKLIYFVIDGAADKINGPTSLERAKKPALDSLTPKGKCGLMYTIGKGIAPESDSAVFSILGYNPHEHYIGRGPVEALGAGFDLKSGYEVAFRANFATIDPATLKIIDRRCGRNLRSDEAAELAKTVDGIKLELYDGYARVAATIGHRGVVIIGSKTYRLSDNVGNTDPAYIKVGKISMAAKNFEMKLVECKPLDNSIEAKRTAELVNIFTKKVIEILDRHPINIKRASRGDLKANVLLLRDGGGEIIKVKPINELFGMKFIAIAEMPVEKGIARLVGMDVAEVPPPSKDHARDYENRLETTLSLLEKYDAIYVHLKGPDEPGHDGNLEGKIRAIELIDKYFTKPLIESIDLENTAIIVTSDHATPWTHKSHTDDPVPVLIYIPGVDGDGISRFTERECSRGSLGLIEHGWKLLPIVYSLMKKVSNM
ncbi:MAG TPA: 2,3-bisphosphoglycerate-independent phosphoglycerate mutase [Thermoprotei archaeon]|nr:2,3-bisphosphoglycerate-independent phosphoglycerate mutase [Thermoprotei archaeon]